MPEEKIIAMTAIASIKAPIPPNRNFISVCTTLLLFLPPDDNDPLPPLATGGCGGGGGCAGGIDTGMVSWVGGIIWVGLAPT